MTSRRALLGTLASAGAAVLAGPAVLEAFERLNHRKVWALGAMPRAESVVVSVRSALGHVAGDSGRSDDGTYWTVLSVDPLTGIEFLARRAVA